ncbi:putative mitochondrial protein AtMg00310 [Silene latifolia]|uniref:putative mitochondrial protein AtMg00310 n=1 Tax=Silene latifolia TaxID=37657 RepID=UPI003D785F74
MVAERLGVAVVEEQKRYLGLPTVIGRSKKVITDIIRDKLSKRLQGWRGKILSRAGKEVLIKAVANSLPTYVMSVFKIPSNFCDELRSMVSRFWWGHGEGQRGISWVAWRKICTPKGVGGLGFRDFHLFNLALLAKQAWRLVTCTDGLWARIMKAKYYPQGEFMGAGIGHNPSYAWRGIVEARGVLEKGMRRRIGDGPSTLVWRMRGFRTRKRARLYLRVAAGMRT